MMSNEKDVEIEKLKVEKAELIEALKEVVTVIENKRDTSDHWWIDMPDFGGVDIESIKALLVRVGGLEEKTNVEV